MDDMEKTLFAAIQRISTMEADNHNIHCRLTDINTKMDNLAELAQSVHTLANETVHIREDINRMDGRLAEIEAKPAKKWDLVITAIITAICSGTIGFVLSQILG